MNLEKAVQGPLHELTTANQKEESPHETIDSLRAQVEKSSTSNSILAPAAGIDVHQTVKTYNYNKEQTTSLRLFVSTSRSIDVKLCIQRAA